jgi:hypothetical protein
MDIRYPIGRGELNGEITPERRFEWIMDLEVAPIQLRIAVDCLSDDQLDTPYRPGGWTVRQIVHHICDSNLNSYIRFKMALTEDNPVIKLWDQERWAELIDAKTTPVNFSLNLLDSLHIRWVIFLRSLSDMDFTRTFIHPESGGVSVERNIWNYLWHSRHHIAQITGLRQRMDWK